MNTIYRIVWNATTCSWVVASEMAKGRKKGGKAAKASAAVAVLGFGFAGFFAATDASASQLCVKDPTTAQQSFTTSGVAPTCGSNTVVPAGATDLAELEASGTAMWVDGTNQMIGFRAGMAGQIVNINSAGQIKNIGAGTAAKDAVNVSQLTPVVNALGGGSLFNSGTGVVTGPSYALTNANTIAGTSGAATDVGSAFNTVDTALGKLNTSLTNINNGGGIKYFHTNSGQADSTATGGEAIAMGGAASASGNSAVALGVTANASGPGALAFGQNAASGGAATIAIGQSATIASGINNAISIGGNSQAGNQSTSLGNGADTHLTSYAVAIGHVTSVTGANGTAIGAGAVASTTNSVALGSNSTTTANLATAGYNPGTGALSGTASTANGEVSLGSAGKERRLTNVAAGAGATDAVNVSQLQSEAAKSNNIANTTASALGTTVGANGTINAPSYALANANSIGGTAGAATTVSSGFSKVDTALGTLNTAVTTAQTTANTANTTANKGWNLSADAGATSQNIAPGATANFAAGTNATVTRSGNTITMGVVNNPTFSGMLTANGGLTVGAGKTVSMGGNTVTNVANGVNNNDAVSVAQLTPIITALGSGATINGSTGVVTGPSYALTNANSIGGTTGAATDVGTAVGKIDVALGNVNTAVTTAQTTANTANTTANKGWNLSADGGVTSQNIAPGGTADFAAGTNAIVTRSGNTVTMKVVDNPTFSGMLTADGGLTVGAGQTISMGGNTVTNVANGNIAAGSNDAVNGSQLYATNANVTQNTANIAGNTTAITNLGTRVTTAEGNISTINTTITGINGQVADAVKYDSAAHASVTLGNAGTPVQVTNVKSGALSAASTDAVNGSQLFATNQNVSQNTTDIAGNTTAIAGNTTSISNITNQINSGTVGLVQQAAAGADLTVGKTTDGAAVDFAGTAGARKLINVTDGTVAAGSKDAVNGSQLFATNQNVTQNTSDIAGNTTSINSLDSRVTTNEGDISTINTTISGMNGQLADAVMYDSSTHDKVTLGSAGTPVQLTNVKNGGLSAASTDAVNGSQLYATNQNVTQNTSDIAGNTTSISSLQNTVNNISTGAVGLVQQSAAGANLTVGKDTDGAAVDFQGTAGARKLINVADGTVAAGSKDAVNGSQLFATNQNVAQNTSDIAGNTTSINNINTQINSGTIGLVQQSAAGANLTVGRTTDGAAVDFAGTAGARKLINVADGTVAAGSKDAVNGSQLFATNQNVAQNTSDIAGNATSISNLDGRVTTNEGNISNLDTRVTTNEGDISTINTTISGMNGQLADAVMYDSATHDKVTLGAAGTPVQVTNVKNGGLSAASSDAVNGSQLFATNQNVAQNTSDIAGNTTSITNLDGRVTQNTTNIAGNTTAIDIINTQINSGTIGLVQQAVAGADLTVGKGTDGVAVDFADKIGNTRTLRNVTAGVAATDAVNMSQLNTTNANVTRVEGKADQQGGTTAAALGGGASYNSATGAISAPSYTLHNADGTTTTASDVGTAVTNIDGRVVQNTSDINTINTQINSGTIGLVQQASAGANLTVGKSTDGAAVDFQGTAGARKLVNVADGTVAAGSKDAVNGGQLHGVSQSMADAIGGGSTVNADGSISAPSYSVHNANGSTTTVNNAGDAISNIDGRVTQNTSDISTINTTINGMNGQLADAVKYDSAAHDKVTLGNAGTPVQVSNVKAGELSATSGDAVNGSQLYATNQQVAQNTGDISNINNTINTMNTGGLKYVQVNSTAAGANAAGSDSVAVGGNTKASAANTVAIGNGAQANQANSVALGAGSVADRGNSVSVGSVGQERQVTNVAAGNLSATSTDAVNGSQLNATNQAVSNLDGRVSNVENTVNTMAGAVTNVSNITNGQSGMFQVSKDSNGTQPVASGSKSTAGGNGTVASGNNSTALGNAAAASADNSVALGANSVADRSNSVSVGSAGKERQVTNVAAGTANTDAVNVGQLKAAGVMNSDGSTNTAVTYDTNADGSTSVTLNGGGNAAVIHNVGPGSAPSDAATVGQVQQAANWSKSYTDQQVNSMGRQVSGGVAAAMAMTSIPQAVAAGQNSIGAGVGTFRGQSSIAVGMSALSASGKFAVKFSASATTQGDAGVGVGASYIW